MHKPMEQFNFFFRASPKGRKGRKHKSSPVDKDPRHPEPYFLILSSRARVSLLFSRPGFRVRVQGFGFRVGPGRYKGFV